MDWVKLAMRLLMAGGLMLAGANHFANAAFYKRMMPPYLPWPLELVYLSGAAEIALGAALLVPRLAPYAAWGVVALLVAVFPANVQMALHPETFREFSPVGIYLRLPVQALLVAWAYWHTSR